MHYKLWRHSITLKVHGKKKHTAASHKATICTKIMSFWSWYSASDMAPDFAKSYKSLISLMYERFRAIALSGDISAVAWWHSVVAADSISNNGLGWCAWKVGKDCVDSVDCCDDGGEALALANPAAGVLMMGDNGNWVCCIGVSNCISSWSVSKSRSNSWLISGFPLCGQKFGTISTSNSTQYWTVGSSRIWPTSVRIDSVLIHHCKRYCNQVVYGPMFHRAFTARRYQFTVVTGIVFGSFTAQCFIDPFLARKFLAV